VLTASVGRGLAAVFLRTLLRFEPDIRANKLHLAPAVPDWIGTLRLERIPIMGGHLGIEVTGEVVKVLEVPRTSRSSPIRGGRPSRAEVAPRADQSADRSVRGAAGEREREVVVRVGPPLDELEARGREPRARRVHA